MKAKKPLLPLFQKFVADSEKGRRRKRNGEKLKPESIENYKYCLKLLTEYCIEKQLELRICDVRRLNKREFLSEKNYWKKFYLNFTKWMYANGCHDNYVGVNMKMLRTFFNYLRKDKNLDMGDFYKDFYVRKEEVAIVVLSPEQLKFLIHDVTFSQELPYHLRKTKDIFVFGCTTGLRYSDIKNLTNKNFEQIDDKWYLTVRSRKTKTMSKVKLPSYAVEIFLKYKSRSKKALVFKPISLPNFNRNLRQIGERAGWTQPMDHKREKLGKSYTVRKGLKPKTRFSDFMSSHMMRRTAITTMLILGMPEHLVRNISGHTSNSSSFYRYVHYAQGYLDKELDEVHEKLSVA